MNEMSERERNFHPSIMDLERHPNRSTYHTRQDRSKCYEQKAKQKNETAIKALVWNEFQGFIIRLGSLQYRLRIE